MTPAGALELPCAPPVARTASARPRRGAGVALSAVTALAVAVALAVLALAAAGTRPRVELSDSMRPVLRAGDVLWLHAIAAREARPGDVVAFADPDGRGIVVHRVVRVAGARGGRLAFVTRGDANTGTERWTVPASGRLGRFTGLRVPIAGRALLRLAGAPLGLLALGGGTLLALLALRAIWRP